MLGEVAATFGHMPAKQSFSSGSTVTLEVDRTHKVGQSDLSLGVTYTQHTLDPNGDTAAIRSASELLRTSAVFQNQQLMGWGADNPEPAPDEYNWASLDNRMKVIQGTGGIPVMTLCCAPDWMKGGKPGTTDWSQLEAAPTPEHYRDFAALARLVALRYPQVRYFVVWNELKGFWNEQENRPDYESYTSLYNQVYDAIKSVRPDAQVGGPYVIFGSIPDQSEDQPSELSGAYGAIDSRDLDAVRYWLDHKHGADFVAVDASSYDNHPSDPFAALRKFSDIAEWLRQQTDIPIWWSEWYVSPWGEKELDDDTQNALMTSALISMIKSGSSVALRWQPDGQAQMSLNGDTESIWSDTRDPGGGQPFPFYASARGIRQEFAAGTPLFATTVSSKDVDALASASTVLLVNRTAAEEHVRFGSSSFTLKPHQVLFKRY
jgi:hypothetical protein